MASADDDAEYDDSEEYAEQPPAGQKTRRSLGDRVRAGAATRSPAPPMSPASARVRIEGLEPRERLLSFAGAGLAAVMGVVVYLIQTNNRHFRLSKGQLTPQTTLLLGFLFAALLLGATLWGRRAPIGFVGLFAFLGFGLPEGIPFLALAVWLLFRSYKFQKEAATAARAAKTDRGPSSSRPGVRSPAGPGSARGSARGSASTPPPRKEANKRYTPKRPAPPPPKPSRRDRKAAQASD